MGRRNANRQGLTFIEIAVAMVIIAVALVPIFQMISRGTADSDLNTSQAFALNKATEVMSTLLDSVPFEALRQGSGPDVWATLDIEALKTRSEYQEMRINDAWARTMAEMLFPGSTTGAGVSPYPCRGLHEDPGRGLRVRVSLRVRDITDPVAIGPTFPNNPQDYLTYRQNPDFSAAPNNPPTSTPPKPNNPANTEFEKTVTFAFYKPPELLENPTWKQKYFPDPKAMVKSGNVKVKHELDLEFQIAQPRDNPQDTSATDKSGQSMLDQADFVQPRVIRYRAGHVADKVNYSATPVICPMKLLIVEARWNVDRDKWASPDTNAPNTQRIHLMAYKGDVDR